MKAEAFMKRKRFKNSNDIAGQSFDIELPWRRFCANTAKAQRIDFGNQARTWTFSGRFILASMFSHITSWESAKVQAKCLVQAKDVATYAARFRLGHWCFCGLGSEKTWKHNGERPSHQCGDGGWDDLALRMIKSFSSGNSVPVFGHSSNR